MKINNQQHGFVISLIAFLAVSIILSVTLSMSALMFYRQRISTNIIKSTQAYYAAEAGIEDALLRLKNNYLAQAASYTIDVGGVTSEVTIPAIVAGKRALDVRGNASSIIRRIQADYSLEGKGTSFFYGAQVGEGGLLMANGSRIKGNVFSSGNITGAGTIDNNVVVAGNNNRIEGPRVKGNVLAHTCKTSVVEGNLIYVTGGANTCLVQGSVSTQSNYIPKQPLPISQQQIDNWKTEAAQGQVISGNLIVTNDQTKIIGPVKITGSLVLSNSATLKMTGTVYVQGGITISNNSKVVLDSAYGPYSGVLLADGIITIANNSVLSGSGTSGSYVLVLSTSASNSAINVANNGNGAIFYTSAGGIILSNNVVVKEVTGYKITLSNNVTIEYESGLVNVFFSAGPGGSWQVTSWKEK